MIVVPCSALANDQVSGRSSYLVRDRLPGVRSTATAIDAPQRLYGSLISHEKLLTNALHADHGKSTLKAI